MKYQDKVLSFADSVKQVEFPERTAKKPFGEWDVMIRTFPSKEDMFSFLDKQNSKPVSMHNAFIPVMPR